MRKALFLLVILALIIAATGCFWGSMESDTVQPLYAVWGANPSDVFAVGGFFGPYITHYNGTVWSQMTGPTGFFEFHGVWGSASNDVFAVGGAKDVGPLIEHYDGSTWTVMMSEPTYCPFLCFGGLNAVWGSSPNDVFAVGDRGYIFHYDGNEWTGMYSGTQVDLFDVYGLHGARVFAVGQGGTILHYNGVNWSQVTSGTTKTLFGVSDAWAVGEGGTILFRESGELEWGPYMSPTREHLFAVWKEKDSSYAYAVGSNGTILKFPADVTTSASGSTVIGLESSGLATSNEVLSADVVNLGDHVTISLNVNVTAPPLTVEDILPDELSYIPGTLVVSGGPSTCQTSEHSVFCKLKGTCSYNITFDVQVTHASGFMGDYLNWYNSGFSTDDLEGEDIIVENTVKIGGVVTTETLTIEPFDGFLKLYNNAWYPGEDGEPATYLGDPLTVPTNKDVHWEVCLAVCNWAGDDISDMTNVEIKDTLSGTLELDDNGMTTYVDGDWSFDSETAPSTLSRGEGNVRLIWKEVPPLEDDDVALALLEISTGVNPGAGKKTVGQQEFTNKVLTEHELNSGALLKFVDPETGLLLSAVTPPIVVTADPNWGQ